MQPGTIGTGLLAGLILVGAARAQDIQWRNEKVLDAANVAGNVSSIDVSVSGVEEIVFDDQTQLDYRRAVRDLAGDGDCGPAWDCVVAGSIDVPNTALIQYRLEPGPTRVSLRSENAETLFHLTTTTNGFVQRSFEPNPTGSMAGTFQIRALSLAKAADFDWIFLSAFWVNSLGNGVTAIVALASNQADDAFVDTIESTFDLAADGPGPLGRVQSGGVRGGFPVIAHTSDQERLAYSACTAFGGGDTNRCTSWFTTNIDTRSQTGLAVSMTTVQPQTKIAYLDSANGDLIVATNTGNLADQCAPSGATGWECEVIDDVGSFQEGMGVAIDATSTRVMVAYTDRSGQGNAVLKVARKAEGVEVGNCGPTNGGLFPTWICEVADNGFRRGIFHDVGFHPSLAIDSQGFGNVSYQDADDRTLWFAEQTDVSLTPTPTRTPTPTSPPPTGTPTQTGTPPPATRTNTPPAPTATATATLSTPTPTGTPGQPPVAGSGGAAGQAALLLLLAHFALTALSARRHRSRPRNR